MQQKNPIKQVLVANTAEGIEKVKIGGYAYVMESPALEYNIETDDKCELMQIGGLLDSKGYGLGLRKGSPLTEQLSLAILEMKENDEYFSYAFSSASIWVLLYKESGNSNAYVWFLFTDMLDKQIAIHIYCTICLVHIYRNII